jgi:hypothetical protein
LFCDAKLIPVAKIEAKNNTARGMTDGEICHNLTSRVHHSNRGSENENVLNRRRASVGLIRFRTIVCGQLG